MRPLSTPSLAQLGILVPWRLIVFTNKPRGEEAPHQFAHLGGVNTCKSLSHKGQTKMCNNFLHMISETLLNPCQIRAKPRCAERPPYAHLGRALSKTRYLSESPPKSAQKR